MLQATRLVSRTRSVVATTAAAATRTPAARSHFTLSSAAATATRSSTSSLATASSAAASSRRSIVSLSKNIDGRPIYSNETDDASKYTFSKCIKTPKVAAIVGAPMALGQPQIGVDQGPLVIRNGGLHRRLLADHWQVSDAGDCDFSRCEELGRAAAQAAAGPGAPPVTDSPIALNSLSVGHANYLVYKAAMQSAKDGKFVLTLGGDHSIAVGSIAAILKARPDTAIIWVDAHADINPPRASGSGNIHGMVLSFLMDLEESRKIPGFEWLDLEGVPRLDPQRLAYIGLRDLDWAEKQIIKSLNIRAFTMMDVDRLGIAAVMQGVLEHLSGRVERPLHLSFDVDSIDPMYAPSTGTRVSGGLSYREAYFICEMAAESGLLGSMDIVEVNPWINEETQNKTVDMAVGLCASAMGNKIL